MDLDPRTPGDVTEQRERRTRWAFHSKRMFLRWWPPSPIPTATSSGCFRTERWFAMAERKPTKRGTQKSAKSSTVINKKSRGFTDEERAAMKERAQELKAAA